MPENKRINVYLDNVDMWDALQDDEAGRLIKAMIHHALGDEVNVNGAEKYVFLMLKAQIDRDAAQYQKMCCQLRENGKKGGRPRKTDDDELQEDENQKVIEETKRFSEKPKKAIEREREREGERKRENKRFTPPTVDEIRSYCLERNNGIDPEAFFAFYESKGWKVGNSPMKSWQSAIITWEKRKTIDKKPSSLPTRERWE